LIFEELIKPNKVIITKAQTKTKYPNPIIDEEILLVIKGQNKLNKVVIKLSK
jgi:hypothetical protein